MSYEIWIFGVVEGIGSKEMNIPPLHLTQMNFVSILFLFHELFFIYFKYVLNT